VTVTTYSSDEGSVSIVNGQKDGGSIVASVTDRQGRAEVAVQYTRGS
jgi:hypothetical protein